MMHHRAFRIVICLLYVAFAASSARSQSTQSTLLGTVKDSTGSVIAGADVKISSVEEGATRVVTTNEFGNYLVPDLKPGHYRIEAAKDGFKAEARNDVEVLARQEMREDFSLAVGTRSEIVEVNDVAGAINSETPSITASFDSQNVIDLPANYRANGSTSPLKLVQSLPGVQPDSNGKYSVQGGLPFMSETSVDGITTQNTGSNNPLSDAWPSAETITELRVDGVGNNAEFGQPGAITSITKSGTNDFHGGLFWYHQNRAFDATAFGQTEKPQKIGNDFGVTAGGPVWIPHLYNGRNRTFFYATYEGFRFPLGQTIQNIVPTQAMRNGDFSNDTVQTTPLNNPFTGGTYGYQLPSVSPIAQQFLSLYPLPNVGDPNVFTGNVNYITNVDNSYHSNQFDIRGDQYIGKKWQFFGRFSWKNIDQAQPTKLLVPSKSFIDQYRMLVVSASYSIKPNLINEFRFGFTRNNNGYTNPFDGKAFAQSVGIDGIADNNLFFNGIPELDFNSIDSLNVNRLSGINQSNVYEYTDTLNWIKGRHTMKFGLDIRHIQSVSPLSFEGADNYGTFEFQSALFTGNDFGDFLLGIPSNTFYDTVSQDNNGRSIYYNFFGQDTFELSSRLTLSLGLRYEYHPGYTDAGGNIGNFDPSLPRSGRVVYPDGFSSILNPGFLANMNACPTLGSTDGPVVNGVACTPVLSANQAGLPQGLRTADKTRFMPRLGFAYRPFNNDTTAIRGGVGMYNITTLGAIFYALTGTLQAGTQNFINDIGPSGPLYQWPSLNAGGSGFGAPQYGTDYFGTANDIHFHDPLAYQWNLSVDHEFFGGVSLRASYIGMRVNHLVWAPSYNDMSYSSTAAATERPLTDRPFPNWGIINNRASSANSLYNAFQLEANRRFHNGLSFNSTYTLAKNTADNQAHQQAFADENGGSRATYFDDRSLDYGEVYGTRRHRWITTALYDLPFGHNRMFGRGWSTPVNAILGGWRLSNIFLLQSGAFVTPYFNGGDPSGTGSGTIDGRSQFPDVVSGVSAVPSNQSANEWVNPAAFACPGISTWTPGTACNIGAGGGAPLPIGRFGNAHVGSITGPGIVNLSTGLSKEFAFTERVHLKAGASFTNVLNHANLADDVDHFNLNVASPDFGVISAARGSDFGGSRTGQVFLRLDF
jgi:Carboxypeptidase regulatory-like domain